MEVSMPLFVIGIKEPLEECTNVDEKVVIRKHIAIEILLNMLIGKSSKLYKELYEKQLLMSEPYLEYEWSKNYAHIAITGQTNNPKEILTKLKEEIKNFKENGINNEHFNRVKNMIYGGYIKEYNDVSDIARMFVSDYFKGINSFDYLEEYTSVTLIF